MTAPFVILGTPRSRTAWLARFLAFEGRTVLHEPSIEFGSINDLYELLTYRAIAGLADSMLTLRWRDVINAASETRIVVVFRPHAEVIASFASLGLADARVSRMLDRLAVAIDELTASVPVLTVPFAALAAEATADLVFRYCLREPLPKDWWLRWRNVNVQADLPDVFRRALANAAGLRTVYPELTGLEATP